LEEVVEGFEEQFVEFKKKMEESDAESHELISLQREEIQHLKTKVQELEEMESERVEKKLGGEDLDAKLRESVAKLESENVHLREKLSLSEAKLARQSYSSDRGKEPMDEDDVDDGGKGQPEEDMRSERSRGQADPGSLQDIVYVYEMITGLRIEHVRIGRNGRVGSRFRCACTNIGAKKMITFDISRTEDGDIQYNPVKWFPEVESAFPEYLRETIYFDEDQGPGFLSSLLNIVWEKKD
jgi:hypothetical protein